MVTTTVQQKSAHRGVDSFVDSLEGYFGRDFKNNLFRVENIISRINTWQYAPPPNVQGSQESQWIF